MTHTKNSSKIDTETIALLEEIKAKTAASSKIATETIGEMYNLADDLEKQDMEGAMKKINSEGQDTSNEKIIGLLTKLEEIDSNLL